ncbi:MAG: hypothetical protein AB7I38_07625 [Dehalococcoidia bacterium]
MSRFAPHTPGRSERHLRRARWLLVASALWATLLAVMPALDGALAAYGPDHEHYTLAGVVPPHHHAHDADAHDPSTASCTVEASHSVEVTPVVCAASTGAGDPSTSVVALARGPAGAAPALTSVSNGDARAVAYADPPPSIRTPPPRH